MLKNTPTAYGTLTKAIHWITAGLVIFMLMLGLYMDTEAQLTRKLFLYNLHKSLGVTILALAFLRIVWHLVSTTPALEPALKWWERAGAKIAHFTLYLLLVCMPLSGWIMSSAKGRAVSWFGLFTLPDMFKDDESMGEVMRAFHEYAAWVFIAVISAHVLGALKHHFIDKGETLRRMLPFVKPRPPVP